MHAITFNAIVLRAIACGCNMKKPSKIKAFGFAKVV